MLQWKSTHYRSRGTTTGRALEKAIVRVRDYWIPTVQKGDWLAWFPVTIRAVGRFRLQDSIYLETRMPAGSKVGPQIDRGRNSRRH